MSHLEHDATRARKVGRDIADAMGDAWLWCLPMSPGERIGVVDQVREKLGIPWQQRRRKQALMMVDVAMASFDLRMERRRASQRRRLGLEDPCEAQL